MEETEILLNENQINYESDLIAKTAFENFGIKYMYPWQRLVVSNILEAFEYHKNLQKLSVEEILKLNEENNDSFCKGKQIVLLPTGAGKSLCFQIPAMLLEGPTLIIYPLLALMTDQQRRMEEGSLRSVIFRGGQTEEERQSNFEKLKNGAKIIIANPEVLENEQLLNQISQLGISHIAIDEAHITSEWGDSFRPSYLNLGKVIKKINPPVVTAFTATASPTVLKRVSEILFDGEAHIVRSESDRKNIHYYVKYAAAKKKEALMLAKTEQRPMIIFCGTRDKAEDMAQELNLCFGSETSKFYHAGLEKSEKEEIEQWFYNSTNGILTATCAYGMGVDKKNIKTVIHLEASETAEAYIQEAGRGGRDGSIAKAILLWSLEDSVKYSTFPTDSREAAMKHFAETKNCRRQVLLDALGAEQAVCSGCDLCIQRKNKNTRFQLADWQETYRIIKHKKNFYTPETIETKIMNNMNEKSRKILGSNIWEHSDSFQILDQLQMAKKIEIDTFLWKGRLKIKK